MKTISLRTFLGDKTLATILMIVLCVQIVAIEGYGVSLVKVGIMALAPLLFVLKSFYITKALLWGGLYWLIVYFIASFHGEMRFSTIGYLGMFVITYIVFYTMINRGAFTLKYFIKLLRWLIMAYGVILILQQAAILVGIKNFPIINLYGQYFLAIDKLPSLSIEPSHTARILAVAMLGYLRCIELATENVPTFSQLFEKEHRWLTILFLWTMLTMGSGTAFIALGILSLYFIRWRTAIYIIPLLVGLFLIGESLELKQMKRAVAVTESFATGDTKQVMEADGSAASRIIPLINTLTIDLTKKESWFGKGTLSHEKAQTAWMRTTDKIAIVEQYGLIAFIISLILAYSCMIRQFLSIETLLFVFLFGMTLGNIYYTWGCMMIFTAIRYFQVQSEHGNLLLEDNNDIDE